MDFWKIVTAIGANSAGKGFKVLFSGELAQAQVVPVEAILAAIGIDCLFFHVWKLPEWLLSDLTAQANLDNCYPGQLLQYGV